jgi:hypothetical protein
MPREIRGHKGINIANDGIEIKADERGNGGASHVYRVRYGAKDGGYFDGEQFVEFQNGPLKEVGANGVTNEALLAIVIDRLEGFNAGEWRCRENSIAITHLETALLWLDKRTRDRENRGVEGTNEK